MSIVCIVYSNFDIHVARGFDISGERLNIYCVRHPPNIYIDVGNLDARSTFRNFIQNRVWQGTALTTFANVLVKKVSYDRLFYIGSIPMFVSFFIVALLSHWDKWDPMLASMTERSHY